MVSTDVNMVMFDSSVSKEFKSEEKSTKTTIPFLKDNEFDYADVLGGINEGLRDYARIISQPFINTS